MKYILVIGDGMSDKALPALSGKTPLEHARIPVIDSLARAGTLGLVRTIPEGFPPGSDTAIMSIFGCSPKLYYSGRAPLEAAAQGIALEPGDAAFRCNNICLSEDTDSFCDKTLVSHSAGGIDGADSKALVGWLSEQPEFSQLAEKYGLRIYLSDSYRHLAVGRKTDIKGLRLSPPHDHLREKVSDNLPAGSPAAEPLIELMETAARLLLKHPLNAERRLKGLLPANAIWFWAEGTAARLPDFAGQYGKTGAVVSAVPLCHGIARLIGLDVLLVDGATGELETNYAGKVEATLEALKTRDFAAVHLEGPDECTHNGDLAGKLLAIERLDALVVAPLLAGLRASGENFRMLILSDHKTLMSDQTHNGEPVPYILYDSREQAPGSGLPYDENSAEGGVFLDDGAGLMSLLFAQ